MGSEMKYAIDRPSNVGLRRAQPNLRTLSLGGIVTNHIDHSRPKAKLVKAIARSEQLCKCPGEFVQCTVGNVEGV